MDVIDLSQAHRQLEQEEDQLLAGLALSRPGALAASPAAKNILRKRLQVIQRLRTALEEAAYAREAAPNVDWDDLRRLAELLEKVARATGADGLADVLRQVETILARIEKAAPAPASPSSPAPDQALVTHVADGDSFTLAGGWRVRCIGIDAPELHGDDQRPAPFALEARGALRAMLEGRSVRLVSDRDDTDRYGRLLRYVYQGETFVNAEMLRLGYAVVLTVRPNVKYQQEFEEFEAQARRARLGLWK